jgi:hypothetical protein
MYPPIVRFMAFVSPQTIVIYPQIVVVCCACFSSNYRDVSSDSAVMAFVFHQTIVMYPPIVWLWHLFFHETIVMYPPIVVVCCACFSSNYCDASSYSIRLWRLFFIQLL